VQDRTDNQAESVMKNCLKAFRISSISLQNNSRTDIRLQCFLHVRFTDHVKAFIRRGVRLVLYRADDPTTTQLTDNNDDNLFSSLLTNGDDVLKQLLPDKTNYQYNLRNRRHNLSLTAKTDARKFVVRQLFKDIY